MQKHLVIRSVKAELLPFFVEKWSINNPNDKFDLLSHASDVSSGVENLENQYSHLFERIYTYKPNSDFSAFGIIKSLKVELCNNKYASIIIPHKSENLKGFTNVVMLAFVISGRVYHGNIDGVLKLVPKRHIVKIIVESILAAIIYLVVLPIFILSLGINTLEYLLNASPSKRKK